MIKRNDNIPIIEDREYINAEVEAHEELVRHGFCPQGRTKGLKKVIVARIENEHTNNEKKEWFYYDNWQEARDALCSVDALLSFLNTNRDITEPTEDNCLILAGIKALADAGVKENKTGSATFICPTCGGQATIKKATHDWGDGKVGYGVSGGCTNCKERFMS